MNRRGFLKIAGTGGVILAAGAAGFALTRTPDAALEPWRQAGRMYPDPMRQALSYAILAPNPHNRQPWIVDLQGDERATLYCDLDRLLPETDPFNRQIVIGLGCFLENFVIAASADGYRADLEIFPEGEPESTLDGRPVAHLALRRDAATPPNPLFAQILTRRTNREPYDMARSVPQDALQRIKAQTPGDARADFAAAGELLGKLRELTREASFVEARTPETHNESVQLMRIGKAEIEANPDGISLGGPFLEALSLAGVLTRESLNDPDSSSFRIGLDMLEESAMTAMAHFWIVTRGNTRSDQILAGRAYMRTCLQAEAEGLALQPMSQCLQEYASMRPLYEKVHEYLAVEPGARVQMLSRLGYARKVGPAPRWALETRLRTG